MLKRSTRLLTLPRRSLASTPARLMANANPAEAQAKVGEAFVLCKNAKIQAGSSALTAGEFLRTFPRGPYTAARTVTHDRVFMLDMHVARMAESLALMVAEGYGGGGDLTEGTDVERLRPHLLASAVAAIAAFNAANPALAAAGREVKLTLLLAAAEGGAAEGRLPFDVYAHAAPLAPRPAAPVRAVVRGAPRENAAAKDSAWVTQRQGLEAAGLGFNETLLAGEGEFAVAGDAGAGAGALLVGEARLLEGLSSNVYAIDSSGGAPALYTAEDGVLKGTVRELVLQCAAEIGLPCVLRGPTLSTLHEWEGAFITSTSRLVLPVDELDVDVGEGKEAVRKSFVVEGGVVERLQKCVDEKVLAASQPLVPE